MADEQLADALDPARSVAVSASAGTGKTHLLITRIIRLLLEGTEPGAILAVTFTRKAASEMQQRLRERLYDLAHCSDRELVDALAALHSTSDFNTRQRARALYDRTVAAARPLRIQTFHAFCQDLLRRFPLDAEVAGDFEIVEATGLLQGLAWDALFAQATQDPDGAIAQALEKLIDADGSLDNTRRALMTFLDHRADWLAFTDGFAERSAHAIGALESLLPTPPASTSWLDSRRSDLQRYAQLLQRKGGKRATSQALQVEAALDLQQTDEATAALLPVFLTSDNPPRARQMQPSKSAQKVLGETDADALIVLHESLCDEVLRQRQLQVDADYRELAQAWYLAGDRLLQHFQQAKLDAGMLDFPDLEWYSARLLHHAHDVDWIHFKLDERIDHILIDEFQDTNPGQWQLLTPLLQEMAAGGERRRSVFLVGDRKQSIYGFRRADPELQRIASDWVTGHLGGMRLRLDHSWRSTDAVITAVNRVFADSDALAEFHPHSSRVSGWGRVEVMPLADPAPAPDRDATLRDPLAAAPPEPEDSRYLIEAQRIAARISDLVATPVLVRGEQGERALEFGDVMILVRTRTHLEHYERALSARHIPYVSTDRGTLLDTLEVRDVEALLTTLVTPGDDLALAHVLRSPLFACGHDDLEALALAGEAGPTAGTHWQARLDSLAARLDPDHALARAHRLIADWRLQADRVPTHDLLNRIYYEGGLISRYQLALDEPGRSRATRNLLELLNLSLRVDAGRSPSITRFLQHLAALRATASDAPAEPPSGAANRVALMTIHAAKGLEAPVVFLADACATPQGGSAFETLVEWPAGAQQPMRFVLSMPASRSPAAIAAMKQHHEQSNTREEQNLLYVAMTRARQLLVVSGTATRSARSATNWYQQVHDALESVATTDADGTLFIGDTPPVAAPVLMTTSAPSPDYTPDNHDHDHEQITAVAEPGVVRPAQTFEGAAIAAHTQPGVARGLVIHKLLETLSEHREISNELLLRLADTRTTAEELASWREEARAVLSHPGFAGYFDAGVYQQAWNEIPLSYRNDQGELVRGTIDRLVIDAERAYVIDYKTQPISHSHARESAIRYASQLRAYVVGVQKLWPDHDVVPVVLYTHPLVAVPLSV